MARRARHRIELSGGERRELERIARAEKRPWREDRPHAGRPRRFPRSRSPSSAAHGCRSISITVHVVGADGTPVTPSLTDQAVARGSATVRIPRSVLTAHR
jgi:hypothetical protein